MNSRHSPRTRLARQIVVTLALGLVVTACKKDPPAPPAPAVAEVSLSALDGAKLDANAKAAGYKEVGNEPEQMEGGTIYALKFEVDAKDVLVNFYDFGLWEKSAAKPSLTFDKHRILYISAMADSGSPAADLAGKVKAKGAVSTLTRAQVEAAVKEAGWVVEEGAEDEETTLGIKTIEIEAVKSAAKDAGDEGDDADATLYLYDFSKAAADGRALARDNRALVVACPEDAETARKVLRKLAGG